MQTSFRLALITAAALSLGTAGAQAADMSVKLDGFMTACTQDPDLIEEFHGQAKATPLAFCECVSGKLKENKATQADVDMLSKMHKDDIRDEDVESFPTLEDLMMANEDYEDACRQSFGITVEPDVEMAPDGEEGLPLEEQEAPDEEGATPE
ncbi:MAG: hypothetical protein ACR2J1_04525 [Methyloceanibacter sp.]|uniref:hypothetical protein n=1 Tax=Methyloceanibacter sp. TaxID=1965321 RepID=UPI003D9AC659